MKQDCRTIECKNVKNSDLFTVFSDPYSLTEAQAALDAYLDDGYALFDASANHSLDVSGEGDTKIVIVWKTEDPMKGEYMLKTAYFTGKTVVIMGVKVDGSNNVTESGLKVHFVQFKPVALSATVLFEDLDAHLHKRIGAFDWTVQGFRKCTVDVYGHGEINTDILENVTVTNRGEITLNNSEGLASCEVVSAVDGEIGTMRSLITGDEVFSAFCVVGEYVFAGGQADTLVHYYDRYSGEHLGSVDIGDKTTKLTTDGKKIFSVDPSQTGILYFDIGVSSPTGLAGASVGGGFGSSSVFCDGDYVFAGHASDNVVGLLDLSDLSVTSIPTHAENCTEINGDGTNIYISNSSAQVIEVYSEDASLTYDRDIAYTYGMGNSGLVTDGAFLYREAASNYSSHLSVIDLSDDSEDTIDTYSGNYAGMGLAGFDGLYVWFTADNGVGKNIYRSAPGVLNPTLFGSTTGTQAPTWVEGGKLWVGWLVPATRTDIRYYNVLQPTSENNFTKTGAPDPDVILADDYITLTLAKLRVRYYTPPESSIDVTRMYYITEYDPAANFDHRLKKFCGNRTLVVNRPDISAVLAESGSEKIIISGVMYDHDGVTPYTYDGLPSDENFYILAQDSDGEYVYFSWYNEEIKNTYFSSVEDGLSYTVLACFQMWERNSTEIDLVNVRDDEDSPLEGTAEWNNIDNEYTVN